MDGIFTALAQSAAGELIRDSVYLYPLANVGHVLAVLVFFGSVAVMDLRLLGLTGGDSAKLLIRRLRPVSIVALAAIAATGLTLFIPEAPAIARNPAFQLKMLALVIGTANVGLNAWSLRAQGEGSGLARATAGASLALWLFVAAMGRSIAYV